MKAIEEYKRTRQILFEKENIQPQSKFVNTNGPVKNVHYLEMGKGQPLIMIHGGGSHASEWINIMKPLAEHFHLFVVDRPGHGMTDPFIYRGVAYQEIAVDFVRTFMDGLGLEKTFLMGNSMGGYFSIVFTMEHPERVEKLLLIGAPAGVNRRIPFMLRLFGWKGINQLLLKTVAKPSFSSMKNIHKQILVADMDHLSKDYLQHCYYNSLLPGYQQAFITMLENVLTLRGWRKDLYLGDRLHRLQVPVRFIWGTEDAFEKPETGMKKASAIEDYKFEVIENAGHCPWLDQPDECAHLIISMLEDQRNNDSNNVPQKQSQSMFSKNRF